MTIGILIQQTTRKAIPGPVFLESRNLKRWALDMLVRYGNP
jgi:hypothetical protein